VDSSNPILILFFFFCCPGSDEAVSHSFMMGAVMILPLCILRRKTCTMKPISALRLAGEKNLTPYAPRGKLGHAQSTYQNADNRLEQFAQKLLSADASEVEVLASAAEECKTG
jgi:hypothetical protein